MSEQGCAVYTHMLSCKSPHFNFEKGGQRCIEEFIPRGTGSTPQASLLKSLLMKLNCTSAAEKRAEDKPSRDDRIFIFPRKKRVQLVERRTVSTLQRQQWHK